MAIIGKATAELLEAVKYDYLRNDTYNGYHIHVSTTVRRSGFYLINTKTVTNAIKNGLLTSDIKITDKGENALTSYKKSLNYETYGK